MWLCLLSLKVFWNTSCKVTRSTYRNEVNKTMYYFTGIIWHSNGSTEVIPVHSGDTESSMFDVKPFVRKHFNVGNHFINVDCLEQQYLHLEQIPFRGYSYPIVEMILGQNMFCVPPPLEYFETDWKFFPIGVRIPLGWVLCGPLLRLRDYFLHASKLLHRLRRTSIWRIKFEVGTTWNRLVHINKLIPILPPKLEVRRFRETQSIHDGCWYHVGMFWADDRSSLPNNYFSALMQLKSLERRLDKNPELKSSWAKIITRLGQRLYR